MIVEKIPPLKCPDCKSTRVTKKGSKIECDDCFFTFDLKKGKKKKRTKGNTGKGHNPRYDTGDYLE